MPDRAEPLPTANPLPPISNSPSGLIYVTRNSREWLIIYPYLDVRSKLMRINSKFIHKTIFYRDIETLSKLRLKMNM